MQDTRRLPRIATGLGKPLSLFALGDVKLPDRGPLALDEYALGRFPSRLLRPASTLAGASYKSSASALVLHEKQPRASLPLSKG